MTRNPEADPLLALGGSGRELWADEPADQYVRRLREGWDDAGPGKTKASEAQMRTYDFKVVLEPDSDGGYVISCPALPGCSSQGGTVDEALVNIREAIELVVEDLKARGEAIPDPSGVLVRSVVITR